LGRQLEDYAARTTGRPVEAPALTQSVQAFMAEGDLEGEVRVMRKALSRHDLSGILLDRYLAFTAARQPDELLGIARATGPADIRNRAVQFAIGSDRAELAYSAVQARGSSLPPVWTNALTALTGDYFNDRSPAIDAAFQAALDPRSIGERLRAPLKPDAAILGSVWFYYGARYGDYLAAGKDAAADGWLPATLEASPENPEAYMALGDSYADAGESAKAITQFEHAVELDPDRGDALDHIARVLWREGRRPEAIARWKAALAVFQRIQSRGVRVPEPFWGRLAAMFTAIGEDRALDQLHGDIANLLSDYYHRNGEYRLHELIQPALSASIASGVGVDWLLELGRSIGEPEMMLRALMMAQGITPAQRIPLQRELVAVLAQHAEASFGDDQQNVEQEDDGARLQLVAMLLNAGDVQAASTEWSKLPPARVPRFYWQRNTFRQSLEIRLASKTGTLGALLERYRSQPETAPVDYDLRAAALELRRDGGEESARSVLEFFYDREIGNGRLTAANFIGLAEVKLQRGDPAAALALLNRMALVSEEGFDSLPRAAELLGKFGRTAEAVDFIRRRIQAVPWDAEAGLSLARNLPAGSVERGPLLAALVADSQAAYRLRAQASRLAGPGSGAAAGTELAVLASPAVTPEAAEEPYRLEARMEAARASSNPEIQLRLWREAVAIAPADERARLGALRAAIALRRDSLALALQQTERQQEAEFNSGVPIDHPRPRYMEFRLTPAVLPQGPLSDEERASIAESLAAAAERLDDLATAQDYVRAAMGLRPEAQRAPLQRKLDALVAEQNRRTRNAARQPVIKDVIEQVQVVRPRIPRTDQ
jgi:tetratricopeptide (TPR) repeat protein